MLRRTLAKPTRTAADAGGGQMCPIIRCDGNLLDYADAATSLPSLQTQAQL
ncbi:hypothetical protein PhaeoP18_00354 [Phaeobacter piscinae]|uniref:Uncharacterized protein n=1 Tax=Phaeobacter piscinae TaxID=1580596 RepID=A0AAN1GNR7_9RHOB|nr:hypothetical protein PhaeoP13_00353 [Phaeobacter piscinae]AUQ75518.1 hypothetical protein PhaeoP71_02674 [Phaeobacter piscinae]AUR34653.1 hypothetical protein PhaeoP18_00354 [Phaeobacter piscinae]